MSDGSGEKTEKATPKKLEDQRKKGQVAQSSDIPKLLVLMLVSEVALDLASYSLERFQVLVSEPLGHLSEPFGTALGTVVATGLKGLFFFILITVGLAIVGRLIGSWLQFGFLFAPEAVKPSVQKLNPVNNIKERFSPKSLTTLLLNALKAAVIALVVYLVLMPSLSVLINLTWSSPLGFWQGVISLFRHVIYATFVILIVLSLADLGFQRFFFARKMRMSIEDLKKESKETQGNPEIKGAQRQFAMELLEQPPSNDDAQMDEADMLVVNPTHVAVALYYDPEQTSLPKLLKKGGDADARRMIERAGARGIPVLQCIRLARAIYPTPTGDYIPRETIKGVAQLYGILRQLEDQLPGDIYEVPETIFEQ